MKTTVTAALGVLLLAACGPDRTLEPLPQTVAYEVEAYVAAPVCGPAKISSLADALPDVEITAAIEIDVGHLRRGALFPEIERAMATEAREVLDAMKECGVPLSSVDGLIAGFSEHDDVIFGARAKDLGRPATLDCLAKKIEAATGTPPWTRTTSGCTTTLKMSEDGTGFAIGPDMVVFASKSLETAVERRVAGKDKSALEGRLAWVRKEVDTKGSAWMAANVSPTMASGLGSSAAGLERVGLGIDATKGLGLTMGAGFGSVGQAKAAADQITSSIDEAKMMLPLVGLPTSLADSITVRARGRLVHVGVFLSPSDLEALRKTIEGATGSAPPPPSPRP